ncbi:DUF3617 domain-containing protein [Variovorax sp. VNK109]|jgi:hypothetical protein|uniref:DUF3617 domain-containing protein n=1 Tax=Variovorax sp. VNK109 TaxID=3400919 RepID=UPI003C08AB4B
MLRPSMRKVAFAASLLFLGASSASFAKDGVKPRIKEGNWRIGAAMEITNMQGPSTGPMEYERCLSPTNTDELLQIPQGVTCSIRDSRSTPEYMTWKLQCVHGREVAHAEGRLDFGDTRITGKIVSRSTSAPNVQVTTLLSGRYVGPCINANAGAKAGARSGPPYADPPMPPTTPGGTRLPLYPEKK